MESNRAVELDGAAVIADVEDVAVCRVGEERGRAVVVDLWARARGPAGASVHLWAGGGERDAGDEDGEEGEEGGELHFLGWGVGCEEVEEEEVVVLDVWMFGCGG